MAGSTTGKPSLWMRMTLFVSLALNVLVIGVVVGFLAFGPSERRADRDMRDAGSLMTRALSDEDRRMLRRDLVSELAGGPRTRGAVVDDIRATLDTVRAMPFDPAAFEAALAEQSNRRLQREDVGRRLLAQRIAAMTDAERAAYADRIEARLTDLAQRVRR